MLVTCAISSPLTSRDEGGKSFQSPYGCRLRSPENALEGAQIAQLEVYAPDLLVRDEERAVVSLACRAPVISDSRDNRIHPAGLGR